MGESTEGRPFYYLCIASPETLADLDRYREIQVRLADPRGLTQEEAEDLVQRGKTIVMISCSIHATEVGAAQMSMELAYQLETGEDEKTREILDNVILLLVPSLNPDGLDLVVDWYKNTLGTPYEGSAPPFLYQKYAGHDNNRDWFMLNLVETRLTVEKLHNVWHPQIVYDLHQMGDAGFRLFVPPYLDPYDPNVDYILRQEIAELGLHMMGELLSMGKSGVSCYNGYDAFAPSRAYQHYHGGVRILSEAASAKLATPSTRRKDELRPTRDGSDPREATWNHPLPWPGGQWRLKDIVEYELIACKACLSHAAKFRHLWLKNFYLVGKRACDRKEPYAYVFPLDQKDPVMLYELLKVLMDGQVEVCSTEETVEVNGVVVEKGSYVVLLAQPYGAYAKTLLEVQKYPDLRQYPGGPPKLPYDVTGHTLPLLMGVKVYLVEKPFAVRLQKVDVLPKLEGRVRRIESWCGNKGLRDQGLNDEGHKNHGFKGAWFYLSPFQTAAAKVVNRLLSEGVEVFRSTVAFRHGEETIPSGSFFVSSRDSQKVETLERLCREYGVDAGIAEIFQSPRMRLRLPRVGVYKSYRSIADEGWLRLVLEGYGFPYESVTNQRIRRGGLRGQFDTILVPSQPAAFIKDGNPRDSYPPEYCGGWGPEGKDAVVEFLEQGGTMVFIDAASSWAIAELGLPCVNVLEDKRPQEFFAPGSILKVIVDQEHPLGFGLPRETPVMFVRSPAWAVAGDISAGGVVTTGGFTSAGRSGLTLGQGGSSSANAISFFGGGGLPQGAVVARHPASNHLLSGWLLGAEYLTNRAAMVEFPVGAGRVILVGFHPYFRGQARGTYKVIFNGIYLGSGEAV